MGLIRRDLLAAVPLGALTALTAGCGPAAAPDNVEPNVTDPEPPSRKLTEFGLQLSTITPLLMADFEATLAQVAAIGYRQVEFSALGFLGRPASMVVDLLESNLCEPRELRPVMLFEQPHTGAEVASIRLSSMAIS